MVFLAVSPGVHTIAALTLTDIESGYSINLRCVISQVIFSFQVTSPSLLASRSVMDIVVHKPDD